MGKVGTYLVGILVVVAGVWVATSGWIPNPLVKKSA